MGGLSSDSCDEDLKEYFEQFGKVSPPGVSGGNLFGCIVLWSKVVSFFLSLTLAGDGVTVNV